MIKDFDNAEIAGFSFSLGPFLLGMPIMRSQTPFVLLVLTGFCLTTSGCAVFDNYRHYQARRQESRANAKLQEEASLAHTAFRAAPGWKKNTYRNKEVLALATPDNVRLEIGLDEQRGLLLVRGAIALDFPVATGKSSHPTPTGDFTVRAKEKDYRSNLYGKILDDDGSVLVTDADTRQDVVPEGAVFSGASMPFWMRLTDSGVGLHVGYVPGRPASHGCIRLRRQTAGTLFSLVKTGTPVVIAEKLPSLKTEL